MCKQCEAKPVYEFTNKRKLCRKCFIRYFQKKVLYIIRKFKMVRRGDVIFYKKRNDFRDAVLENVLKMFAEKANAKLTKTIKNADKTAVSSTLDSEADEITQELMKENFKMKFSPVENKNKIIKPLFLFLDEEILLYAKIKKLKFKKKKEKQTRSLKNRRAVLKKSKVGNFIDELEKKHPEIKRAIVNGMLKMQRR